MQQATYRDVFECSVDTFWSRVFFDEEYNRRLYREELGFPRLELLRLEDTPDGGKIRKVRQTPKQEMPAFVQKIAGDAIHYVEEGRYDPKTGRWTYTIVTSAMPDKVRIGGELWCEPRGEGRCERICAMRFEVKVFGVGGKIEELIEQQSARSYRKAAAFTNAWLREKGLAGT